MQGERKMTAGERKRLEKKRASDQESTKSGQPDAPALTEASAPSWDRFAFDKDWDELAAEYLALNAEANRVTKRKEELSIYFKGALRDVEETAIRGSFFVVRRVKSHTQKKINPLKMLECGIEQEVIDYCYEGGEEYEQLRVELATEK